MVNFIPLVPNPCRKFSILILPLISICLSYSTPGYGLLTSDSIFVLLNH